MDSTTGQYNFPPGDMRYTIDLSPTRPSLDARCLEDVIRAYLDEQHRRVQEKTVHGYRRKLKHFIAWWQENGPRYGWSLDALTLFDFQQHLETVVSERDEPLSWHSRNDIFRRLKQVFHWAHRRNITKMDFAEIVPKTKGAPPARRPVELECLQKMFDAARRSPHPLRNETILAVLAGTGVRCEECAGLNVEDVTVYADQSGYLYLRQTKNDKPRIVAFDTATGAYLVRQLDGLERGEGPLFPSRKGCASLSASGVYKVIKRLALDAGVEDVVQGPHDLRRLFATFWSRNLRGESYGQLLQDQLGHEHYNTTKQYSLQDVGDTLEVMRNHAATPVAQLASTVSKLT